MSVQEEGQADHMTSLKDLEVASTHFSILVHLLTLEEIVDDM